MVYGIAGESCSNIAALKNAGFIDFHLVIHGGAAPTTQSGFVQRCNAAGVSPIMNNGNDGISGCQGYDPESYYKQVASLGWHAAGGESEPKAEWKAIMNNLIGMDYGGEWNCCQDLSNIWVHQMQSEVVSGKGMAAYLETYVGVCRVDLCPKEVVNAAVACKAHGVKEVGLMIGSWMVNHGFGAQAYLDIIDQMEARGVTCAGVVLWSGYNQDMNAVYAANAGVITGIQAVHPPRLVTLKERFAGPIPTPVPIPMINVDVFCRGQDSSLWWKPANADKWQTLGGVILEGTAPASARVDNVLYVFVTGTDHAVWMRSRKDNTWTGWQSLGGYLTSSPAVP
jgi:hypothetical protein